MTAGKDHSLTVRVEADLWEAFSAACKRNDMSGAQILRSAMRDYVKANAQAELPLGLNGPGVSRKGKK